MKKEKFLNLLSKKLAGSLSNTEREELSQALAQLPEYQKIADELERKSLQNQRSSKTSDSLSATWEKIRSAEHTNTDFIGQYDYQLAKKSRSIPQFLKIAAALLLLASSVLVTYQLSTKQNNPTLLHLTTTRQKSFIQLEDGTRVWLNKNSKIRYNDAFGKKKRELFLEGEAYFDVTSNKRVPLFIHAGGIDIQVMGTAFNVKAYKEHPEVQVALVRGLIQVSDHNDPADQVMLLPNQRLTFHRQSTADGNNFKIVSISAANAELTSNWSSDTLVFHKEKLKDLVLQLEKKYQVKIEVQTESLKQKRFSGTFINESIQQVLAALKLTYPLTYTINGKLVIIKD